MPRHLRVTRRLEVVVVVVLAVLAAGTAIVVGNINRDSPIAIDTHCSLGPGGTDPATSMYNLDLEQAANASTISAIGKRLGLPDHAVTVALATALQESKLRNVNHGDLDSLGLFQQRPSQGWGSTAQVMDPTYSTVAFYTHLTKVRGWETLAVADAAQRVQHSASGDAYAQWEPEARGLAAALTGEVPAGLACQFDRPAGVTAKTPTVAAPGAPLTAAMRAELGAADIGVPLATAQGWTVAGWLVGHASQFRIASVSFAGKTWTGLAGTWVDDPSATSMVQIRSWPPLR